MADFDLALGIKPPQIDVATPLLTAAKIRAADLEAQKHAVEMQFLPAFQQAQLRQLGLSSDVKQQELEQSPLKLAADLRQKNVTSQAAEEELRAGQIGKVLRGIAPYADKPEFQAKADEAHQELLDRKLITPQQYAAYKDSGPYSPVTLQGALSRTLTAEQALKEDHPVAVAPGAKLVKPLSGQTVAANEDISDEDAKAIATRYVDTGNRMVMSGVGLRGTARNRVQHFIDEVMKEKGISTQDMGNREAEWEGRKAGQRVLGTQEAKMGSAAFEAEGAIKLARPIVDKVPRTSILPFNQLIQGYQKQTLDPDQAELFTRLQAIVNTYSAVMSRGANITTDASRHRAEDLLNSAADAKTLHRVMNTMQQEIDMAKNSPERMRKFYNEKYGAKSAEGGATATPAAAPAGSGTERKTQSGITWSVE